MKLSLINDVPTVTVGGPVGRTNPKSVSLNWQLSSGQEARRWLPYGIYILADGSEVLFNRDYCPLWQRPSTRSSPEEADHGAVIPYVERRWFFKGAFPGSTLDHKLRRECERAALVILDGWGVKEPFRDGMPTQLYRIYDVEEALLYVGVSLNVLSRTEQHADTALWFREVVTIKVHLYHSLRSALMAETEAIATERPRHNVRGLTRGV